MNSLVLPQFWQQYYQLAPRIRRRAARAYRLWQENPDAPGLHFKRVGNKRPVYSIRVGQDYRALGVLQGDTVTWFWIGHHDDYVRLLKHS